MNKTQNPTKVEQEENILRQNWNKVSESQKVMLLSLGFEPTKKYHISYGYDPNKK